VLPYAGETDKVTAFGTHRCVSGQFRLALLPREVPGSMSISGEAGHNIGNREKTKSLYVCRVMHPEIASVLQKKKSAPLFRV
jgi:hypothetical protein